MAEFLSEEWLSALAERAAEARVPEGVELVVQQVVLDEDGAERAYVVRAAAGRLAVEAGRTDAPDVSFTQRRSTAVAIARGERSAQAAFLAGELRIGGQPHRVAEAAAALAALGDPFAEVRTSTDW